MMEWIDLGTNHGWFVNNGHLHIAKAENLVAALFCKAGCHRSSDPLRSLQLGNSLESHCVQYLTEGQKNWRLWRSKVGVSLEISFFKKKLKIYFNLFILCVHISIWRSQDTLRWGSVLSFYHVGFRSAGLEVSKSPYPLGISPPFTSRPPIGRWQLL